MRTQLDRPIVVGVNGSPETDRAIRYAVLRAEQCGCGLHIVNAVHEMLPIAPVWPLLTGDSLMDVGLGVLADAQVLVERVAGAHVPVEVQATLGPAVAVLTAAADGARLVVLGRRPDGVLEHLFTGATTFGVVARASCPVVSVAHEWHEHRTRGRVVAAIDGSEVSSSVLAHAFALASQAFADVHVVHCWKLDALYAYLVDEMSVRHEWRTRTASTISTLVDQWSSRYPGVRVVTHLEYADVARTLIGHSRDADVLVVGRHDHGGLQGRIALSSPGSIARTLVQHAHSPVEFVPLTSNAVPLASDDSEDSEDSEDRSRPMMSGDADRQS